MIPGVLDHLSIQCADPLASAAFYDSVLAPLGGSRLMQFGDVIGYGMDRKPSFWLGPLTTGEPNREIHIAFQAPDRAAVRAFFDAAIAAGAAVLHSPRVWPEQRLVLGDEWVFGRMPQGIQSDDLSLMAERCHPNRNRLSVKDVLDLLASQALR
jgi:catechol 2,3-dioxygenase-like lactoylglutathione lyase family enzyme